jgi:hypothetical protein
MTTRHAAAARQVAAPGRVLGWVMRWDKVGSFHYYPIVLIGSIAVLAGFHPHGLVLAVIWAVLGGYGLWLGVLGIAMAYGLTRAMLRDEEISGDWYGALFR